MFFVANKRIAIEEVEFWEKSYLQRSAMSGKLNLADNASALPPLTKVKKELTGRASVSLPSVSIGKEDNKNDFQVCPFFIKDIAKVIISAGKSLQLIRHAPMTSLVAVSADNLGNGYSIAGLTLSEVFCLSLTALIGHGDHITEYLWKDENNVLRSVENGLELEEIDKTTVTNAQSKKFWQKLFDDTLAHKRNVGLVSSSQKGAINCHHLKGNENNSKEMDVLPHMHCPQNPAITVCREILQENKDAWSSLNISQAFYLPPLNDETLRQAVFSDSCENVSIVKNMDYNFGFLYGESERLRFQEDAKMLESLLPFPTLLPSLRVFYSVFAVLKNDCSISFFLLGLMASFNYVPGGP